MGKEIDHFTFFRSFLYADLPNDERLSMYDAIIDYGLNGLEPRFDDSKPYLKLIFQSIRPNIESSRNRVIRNTENGKKGGAPKGNQNARKKKTISELDFEKLREKYQSIIKEALEIYSIEISESETSPGVLEEIISYCERKTNEA